MTESFLIKRSFLIPPIAIKYLQDTISNTPGCIDTVEEIIEAIDSGAASLFLVEKNTEVYGVIFATIIDNPNGKNILNGIMGGKNLKLWKNELLEFLRELTKITDTELCLITRKGWQRIYPEFRITGYVYTL